MQELSRTCLVVDHYQMAIEYVCVYPQCQSSRFLCPKCLLETNHKHNLLDNSHILINRDFYDRMSNKLNQLKDTFKQRRYDIEKSIVSLKQIIQDIQNLLKNIQNISNSIEQGKLQNIHINNLERQLINIEKYGFSQIDEQSLNKLISIPEQQQQDPDIYNKIDHQSNLIIQNAQKIKKWRLSQQVIKNQEYFTEKIKKAKYSVQKIDDTYINIFISELFQMIQNKLLKIWDYETNNLIKSIEFNQSVQRCMFTEDSTLLYAGSLGDIYQFDAKDQFKELCKQSIHNSHINNINCISNTIILTVADEKEIIKTDINNKKQLLQIQAHNNDINGLDYNKRLEIIASGSDDKSIKLWSGNDGTLIIEKLNAHSDQDSIRQVLFIVDNNQLVSLDSNLNLIIWNINYETKKLEQLQFIENVGYNISLVLQQQYLVSVGNKFIKVYQTKGELVRQFDHQIDNFYYCYKLDYFNTLQPDSMMAVLIQGDCNKIYLLFRQFRGLQIRNGLIQYSINDSIDLFIISSMILYLFETQFFKKLHNRIYRGFSDFNKQKYWISLVFQLIYYYNKQSIYGQYLQMQLIVQILINNSRFILINSVKNINQISKKKTEMKIYCFYIFMSFLSSQNIPFTLQYMDILLKLTYLSNQGIVNIKNTSQLTFQIILFNSFDQKTLIIQTIQLLQHQNSMFCNYITLNNHTNFEQYKIFIQLHQELIITL
ncbi:hypothetical protein pb186bvf_014726 [Paramecium bursaria]